MANRPANAGSGRGNAGSGRGLAPAGNAMPPLDAVAPPPPVRHDALPSAVAPRPAAGHRAARTREPGPAGDREGPGALGLAWVPYLIVLAGVAAGLFVAWQGPKYAARGTGLLGCSLIAAGLARLVLPPRLAALLSTRRKASDVLAFVVLGTAVLTVALMLP